jgi:hypothetical protein
MPGRRALRTAAVVGVASHHGAKKANQQNAAAQQQAAAQQPPAPPTPQAAAPVQPAPAANDLTAKLQELDNLHKTGVLTDDEYAAAKQKALAG